MLYWGKHLILNGAKGNHNVKSALAITTFSQRLVSAIDMKAYGSPIVVHFGEDNKAGYTLTQLIETSNIMGHFCDSSNDFYIDVFSCKDYDERIVKALVKEVFDPKSIESYVVFRDANKCGEVQKLT